MQNYFGKLLNLFVNWWDSIHILKPFIVSQIMFNFDLNSSEHVQRVIPHLIPSKSSGSRQSTFKKKFEVLSREKHGWFIMMPVYSGFWTYYLAWCDCDQHFQLDLRWVMSTLKHSFYQHMYIRSVYRFSKYWIILRTIVHPNFFILFEVTYLMYLYTKARISLLEAFTFFTLP